MHHDENSIIFSRGNKNAEEGTWKIPKVSNVASPSRYTMKLPTANRYGILQDKSKDELQSILNRQEFIQPIVQTTFPREKIIPARNFSGEASYAETLKRGNVKQKETKDEEEGNDSTNVIKKSRPMGAKSRNQQNSKSNKEQVTNKSQNSKPRESNARVQRKKTVILGDSMVKHIEGWKMRKALRNGENVVVHSFRGATTDDMKSYILPTKRRNPGHVVIHVGTNDLESGKTPKEIAKDIYDIAQSLKTNMVTKSGFVPQGDQMLNGKVVKVNDELMEITRSCKFEFVDHSNINPENYLNGSRLHTNKRGTAIIANNFIKFLCN